jgi:hypothetical protein
VAIDIPFPTHVGFCELFLIFGVLPALFTIGDGKPGELFRGVPTAIAERAAEPGICIGMAKFAVLTPSG